MLLKLIKNQRPDIDKNPFESKYQFLINGREKVGIKKLKNPKIFIDYSQAIHSVSEDLEDYNLIKKRKVLIEFDDIIGDVESNEKN